MAQALHGDDGTAALAPGSYLVLSHAVDPIAAGGDGSRVLYCGVARCP